LKPASISEAAAEYGAMAAKYAVVIGLTALAVSVVECGETAARIKISSS
jgi:hypothetical protein